jgi:hypothetical protein
MESIRVTGTLETTDLGRYPLKREVLRRAVFSRLITVGRR